MTEPAAVLDGHSVGEQFCNALHCIVLTSAPEHLTALFFQYATYDSRLGAVENAHNYNEDGAATGARPSLGSDRRLARRAKLWLSALVLGGALTMNAQEALLYIPYVAATTGAVTQSDSRTVVEGWQSNLTLFNNGSTTANWRWVAAYGGGEQLSPDSADPYCMTSTVHEVPPGTGASVGPCFVHPPSGGLAIVVLRITGSLIPHSTVSRIHILNDCTPFGGLIVPQGRVPAPVFTSPFPAGSTVVSGDIDLGNAGLGFCVSPNQRYARRVNVTMFNLGDVPALFQVTVQAGVNSASAYSRQTVSVPAKDVVQINSLPLHLDDVAQQPGTGAGPGGDTIIWILITADQPFLSYVSTIFDNPEPDAMPMEVYPSHLQN